MKPEDIQTLRSDFADLIASTTTIDPTMPDAWLQPVRNLLAMLRVIHSGSRVDIKSADIHVRSISAALVTPTHGHSGIQLDCLVHAPTARGATLKFIQSSLRSAQYAARDASRVAVRALHRADIEVEAARYVHDCVAAGRILEQSDGFVAERVQELLKGQLIQGVDETKRSRFLKLNKGLV